MKHQVHKGFICMVLAVTAVCVILSFKLLKENRKQTYIFQEMIDLGNMTYDDAFLKEAEKIPGVRSITPVLEVPAQIKIDEYTMDTVFTGVSLEEYQMKVVKSWETFRGADPVLVIGENSLSGLADANGHTISAGQLKQIMEDIDQKEIAYRVSASEDVQAAAWKKCRVAGIFKNMKNTTENEEGEGADKILIPVEQAFKLAGYAGSDNEVHRILLTVQGEEQMKRAETFFAQ